MFCCCCCCGGGGGGGGCGCFLFLTLEDEGWVLLFVAEPTFITFAHIKYYTVLVLHVDAI